MRIEQPLTEGEMQAATVDEHYTRGSVAKAAAQYEAEQAERNKNRCPVTNGTNTAPGPRDYDRDGRCYRRKGHRGPCAWNPNSAQILDRYEDITPYSSAAPHESILHPALERKIAAKNRQLDNELAVYILSSITHEGWMDETVLRDLYIKAVSRDDWRAALKAAGFALRTVAPVNRTAKYNRDWIRRYTAARAAASIFQGK